MRFESNARWSEPKETGTIFTLKNNGLGIIIHRLFHVKNSWFLSCRELNISSRDLHESDFDEAVETAKVIINQKIGELIEEYNKIVGDDVIEFE